MHTNDPVKDKSVISQCGVFHGMKHKKPSDAD